MSFVEFVFGLTLLSLVGFLVAFIHYHYCRRNQRGAEPIQQDSRGERKLPKERIQTGLEGYVSILCTKAIEHEVTFLLDRPQILRRAPGIPDDCLLIYANAQAFTLRQLDEMDGVLRINRAFSYGCPDT